MRASPNLPTSTSSRPRGWRWVARAVRDRPAPLALALALAFFVGAAVSMKALYVSARTVLQQSVRQSLSSTAQMAALSIDPDAHALIQRPEQEGTPEYEAAVRPLRAILSTVPDLYYVYTFRAKNDQVRFALDATPSGDRDGDGVDDHSYVNELYTAPDVAMHQAIATEMNTVAPEPYTDRWGTFLSAYAPVRRTDGSIECFVGVDVNVADFEAQVATMRTAARAGLGVAALGSILLGFTIFALRRSGTRAQQAASRIKNEFVAKISHELRTPISAIVGYSELLSDQGQRPAESPVVSSREAVDAISRNASHLLSLVNDLLDVARVEAGQMKVQRVPTDVRQLAQDVMEALRMRVAERKLTLYVHTDPAVPRLIMSDPVRLRQVLTNLVFNAVKFTERGSVWIQICNQSNQQISVSVRDTGKGMQPEELSRLFKPFTQLDNSMSRSFGGAGLGLAISKQLSELMGGSISVKSTPGRGSEFTVLLPRSEATADAGARAAPAAECQSPLAGCRILLAEDGPDNARLITHQLRAAGADVTQVWDGKAAIRAVEGGEPDGAFPFDLILMDMQMPEMDGYDATAHLRAQGVSVPIIGITAHGSTGDRARCLEAGCDDYASKPIARLELLELCVRWVRQRTPMAATTSG